MIIKLSPPLLTLLFVAFMSGLPGSVFAGAATNAPVAVGADAFRIVAERNIFDPSRRPRTSVAAAPFRKSRVEAFALVGTLSSEKGQFAFFDGTSSVFKKAVQAGGKVGDYTVADIASNQVTLVIEDDEVDFPMGMQMRRVDEGEWKLLAMNGTFTAPVKPLSGRSTSRTASRSNPSSALDSLTEEDFGDLADLPDKALRKLVKEADAGMNPDKPSKGSKSDPELKALKRLDKLDKRMRQ